MLTATTTSSPRLHAQVPGAVAVQKSGSELIRGRAPPVPRQVQRKNGGDSIALVMIEWECAKIRIRQQTAGNRSNALGQLIRIGGAYLGYTEHARRSQRYLRAADLRPQV